MTADEPLTPRERALAEHLRLSRQALPSAALDASILAAARAAVAAGLASMPPLHATDAAPAPIATAPLPPDDAGSSARPRHGMRWPALTGLAAALALAVGIAWQVRLPAPAPAAGSAPRSLRAVPAAPLSAAHAPAMPGPVPIAAPSPVAPPPAAPAPPADADATLAKTAARAPQVHAVQRQQQRMLWERRQVLGERADSDAADAHARQAPASVARMQGGIAAAPAAAVPSAADAAPASPSAHLAGADPALAAIAQADARLSRRRWLERIRARRDAGAPAAARASLQRFQREHPHARIPEDLRDLLND
ncbi:hypothetical protein [Xanthomonas theicola]|uniref:Uncharacterized protein n=1 Tax=Xanthomonas theicola TaxID=56464 RepID=A0A2S6ZIT9_9XANT|nr:hypothetical protein [Xanthomonas theicola]PPT92089.1 hypothetical protein XthCFBP4691_05315 [Xanthomonas theicola]QNH25205.1 hypothetical protein G4Q83_11310 [Xanthomonas theicola]